MVQFELRNNSWGWAGLGKRKEQYIYLYVLYMTLKGIVSQKRVNFE